MGKKNFQAGQLIPTSSTPPGNAGFYRIDKNTIGVVGNLVQKNANTNVESNVSTGANLAAELAAQTSSVTESRTLALTDNGMVLNCNSGSAIVLTIPPASSVVWSGVSCVAIYQAGAGASSFAAGPGVTLRGTPPTPAQYATHAIMRVGVNEWAYL
jgi:hypothetical protein